MVSLNVIKQASVLTVLRKVYSIHLSKGASSHTLTGKFEKIGGYDCYIATPTIDYPKDAVILFLTDAFGIELSNNQVPK